MSLKKDREESEEEFKFAPGSLYTDLTVIYNRGGGGFPVVEAAKSSSDASINISKGFTVTGKDRVGLTIKEATTSYMNLMSESLDGTTEGGKKAFVYIRHISTNPTRDLILADDGSQIFSRLRRGEFMFYPTADNTNIQVKSSAGTVFFEYMYFTQQ